MRRGLSNDAASAQEHLNALKNAGVCGGYREQLDFLYGNLSILDAKASSLLSFNAIGLAILAIWLSSEPYNRFHFLLDTVFVLFLASCCFCLKIVWLHWASTGDLADPDKHAQDLVRLRDNRTLAYRRAWLISTVAVAITCMATLYHMVEVGRQAFAPEETEHGLSADPGTVEDPLGSDR